MHTPFRMLLAFRVVPEPFQHLNEGKVESKLSVLFQKR